MLAQSLRWTCLGVFAVVGCSLVNAPTDPSLDDDDGGGGACPGPLDTLENCGDCGTACAPANVLGPTCETGTCGYSACEAGFGDCDGDTANGCELRLDTLTDCGGCGVACGPDHVGGATCAGGVCGYDACLDGFADCNEDPTDGCEVDTATDVAHCGGCELPCPSGSACQDGICSLPTSCQEILLANPQALDGPQTIEYQGEEREVYCHMTGGGETYLELAFGRHDLTYPGYTPVSLADLQSDALQQAFVFLYNQQGGGAVNIDVGYNSNNCCFKFAEHAGENTYVALGGRYLYPATLPATEECSTGYTASQYSFVMFDSAQGNIFAPATMGPDFFTTNAPGTSTSCTTAENPAWFWRKS